MTKNKEEGPPSLITMIKEQAGDEKKLPQPTTPPVIEKQMNDNPRHCINQEASRATDPVPPYSNQTRLPSISPKKNGIKHLTTAKAATTQHGIN